MKILFTILAFAFCLFATSNSVFGQICREYPCVVNSTETGEVASAAIDNFIDLASRTGGRIFVIARLGTQETDSKQNLDRLCEARDYILDRLPNVGDFREYPIVFAEGAYVEGEGRLEFYLGSKLQLTRIIKRNREANLNCCGELTRAERKQKRKECRDWKEKGTSNKSLDTNGKQRRSQN
ncbi:MAG: hypothetical protein LC768_02920 [Acidobacteria bacterium]|nr:hypothetical protein [Acidobacteriota bacterium]MCA1637284.1 hypothetical protein [Acidobacteriota bacterium]